MELPNRSRVEALLDSGASLSCIAESETKNIELINGESINISGYGNKPIQTIGKANIRFLIARKEFTVIVHIVNDSDINNKLILGKNFLKEYGVQIDTLQSSVKLHNKDNSSTLIKLNEENKIINIQYENIPVYALETKTLKKNDARLISINTDLTLDNNRYLFEGIHRNGNLMCITGIICNDEPKVLIQSISNKGKQMIRKGEKVGYINTLIEVDADSEPEIGKEWTLESLQDQIKINHRMINQKQQEQVYNMLMSVNQSLSKSDNDIGQASVVPYHISLTNSTPIYQKPRNFAQPVNEEIENQCQDLLSQDIIEYSNSRWSSPVVPVRKHDQTLRLCIDYRKLNLVTKTEHHPMPNLTQCLYKAHNTNFFTKLDLIKGYYQIELDEESKQCTSFSTTQNQYQFKRLPFGLKNAGIAFQKYMQQILSSVSSNKVIIYIDDILILSSTFGEHLDLVQKVLRTLAKYNIKVKISKCQFFKENVQFLGHNISNEGIQKSEEYIEKIKDFPKPTTITQLRQFLGLINFQRKFIPHCSEIIKPLSEITGQPKRSKIVWTQERTDAFNKIIEEIEKDVKLSYPDYSKEASKLELFVDASNTGVGACLMQKQNEIYKTIGYASTTFSKTQQRYSTIERELCAIKFGCNTFRPFIFGVDFILHTDHKPLIYMNNMAPHNSRIYKTLQDLADYNFKIVYRPGKFNVAADYLSRLNSNNNEEDRIMDTNVIPDNMKVLQKIEGGGNSMFQAIYVAMECLPDVDLPTSHHELRQKAITELIDNPHKYDITKNKQEMNKLKIMLNSGQLPCTQTLLAISFLCNIEIQVFYDSNIPHIYNADVKKPKPTIYLQCIASIHFNPLIVCKKKPLKREEKYLNVIHQNEERLDVEACEEDNYELENLFLLREKKCKHARLPPELSISYNNNELCALIDTGSQVSLINEEIVNKIATGEEIIRKPPEQKLVGIGKGTANVVGIVDLKIQINNFQFEVFPFAIIREPQVPTCVLLGFNFIQKFKLKLDFKENILYLPDNEGICFSMTSAVNTVNRLMSSSITDESETENDRTCKIILDEEHIKAMQENNTIRKLKINIKKKISCENWKESYLLQFKRFEKDLEIDKDLLVKRRPNGNKPVVVSFPFLVDIIDKVHKQVSHVGRHKLLEIIKPYFWHPATDKIAREICASCEYCQLFKTNIQQKKPPKVKIQCNRPFQLVSVDLMQLPKSKRGNNVVLVAIDHYSKWLSAIALKDKTANSVCKALKNHIIPSFAKVPNAMLSDNGPEFRSAQTEDVLKLFNIKHVYSSPFNPTSNGSVERANRTVKELMKATIDNITEWDDFLPKVITTYNNTHHSQIGCTPSQMILTKCHMNDHISIDNNILENWKPGHPNFAPFKIGQKVIKVIHKTGNLVKNKLTQKFEGPYIVTKVQSNGVSYEIKGIKNPNKVVKANHKQLREWKELSIKLQRILNQSAVAEIPENKKIKRLLNFGLPGSKVVKEYFISETSSTESSQSDEDVLTHTSTYSKEESTYFDPHYSDIEHSGSSTSSNSSNENNNTIRLQNSYKQNEYKDQKQNESRTIKRNLQKTKELSLLTCSEPADMTHSILQSSVKEIQFNEYLENITLNTFSVLEALTNMNQEVHQYSIELLSELCATDSIENNILEYNIENETRNNLVTPAESRQKLFTEMRDIINNCVRLINEKREQSRQSGISGTCIQTSTNTNIRTPINSTPIRRRMILRSQGQVENYPNVMPNIIERKKK